jgi:hypothetical protein
LVDEAFGRGNRADAATRRPVLLGRNNRARAATTIANVHRDGTALRTRAHGRSSIALEARSRAGVGIHGESERSTGVQGVTVFGNGVDGMSFAVGSVGVFGNSVHGFGVRGDSFDQIGVIGESHDGKGVVGANVSESSPAVQGWAQAGQTGVQGISTTAGDLTEPTAPRLTGVVGACDAAGGTGVLARSRRGTALRVEGTISLTSGGLATIPSGARTVTVTPGFSLTADTKILCTQQQDPGGGASVQYVDHDERAFTAHLTAPAQRNTTLAWLVIS